MRNVDNDDLRNEDKRDKDRDRDKFPEREERKLSKDVEKMSDKEIMSLSRDIIDRKGKEDDKKPLKQKERIVLERASKLDKEKIDENRRNAFEIRERVNLHHPQKGDIKKIAALDREYTDVSKRLEQTRDILNPKRAEARIAFSRNETDKNLVERVEGDGRIAVEKGKIYSLQPQKENSKWTHRDSVNMALDIAKYQGITGRDIDNTAKSEISRMRIKEMDERHVPKFELERIATSKHPDAIRTFYEFGLRVGDEKLKPDQLNNAVKLLNAIPREHEDGRKEVISRLLSGQIHNSKMDEKSINRLASTIDRKSEQRAKINNLVDKEIEKDDKKEKNSELRENLLRQDGKLSENITNLILSSKERIDFKELKKICDESKRLDKEPERKDKQYTLKEEELRTMVLSRNAYIIPQLEKLDIKLPNGIDIKNGQFSATLNLLNDKREKNELVRLAALSTCFSRDEKDKNDDRIILGRAEEKPYVEKIMTYSPSGKDFDERYEDIRNYAKGILSPTRESERIPERDDLKLPDLRNYDAKQAAAEVSKYFGSLCKDENYSRGSALKDIENLKKDIKQYNVDIYSLDAKDRCIRDTDLTKIVSKDPQLVVDLQKMGIALSRNGDANVERLQDRIDLIKQVPKEEDTLRMGILSTCLTRSNNTSVSIQNPFNLMDAEKNKEAKEIAKYIVAEEKGIRLSTPAKVDDKYISLLSLAREDIRDYQRLQLFEKDIKENVKDKLSDDKKETTLKEYSLDYMQKGLDSNQIYTILFSDRAKENLTTMTQLLEREEIKSQITLSSSEYEDKLNELRSLEKDIKHSSETEINIASPFSNCINSRGREITENPLSNIIIADIKGFPIRDNLSGSVLREYDDIRESCLRSTENITNVSLLSDEKIEYPSELITDNLRGVSYDSCIELIDEKNIDLSHTDDKNDSLYKNTILSVANAVGYLDKQNSFKIIDEKMTSGKDVLFIEKDGYEKIEKDIEKLLSISRGEELDKIKDIYSVLEKYEGKQKDETIGAAYPPNASHVREENIRRFEVSPLDFSKFEQIRDSLEGNVAKISVEYPSYEREHGNGYIEIIGLSDYCLSTLSDDKLQILHELCPSVEYKVYSSEEKEIYSTVNGFFVEGGRVAEGADVDLATYDKFMRSIEDANKKYEGNILYESTKEDVLYLKEYVASIHGRLNQEYERMDEIRKREEAREEEALRDAALQPDPDYSNVDLEEKPIYEEKIEISHEEYESSPYATVQTMMNTDSDRFEYAPELQEYYEDILRAQESFGEQLKIFVPTDDTTMLSMFYDFKSDSVVIKQTDYNVDDSSTTTNILFSYNGEERYPDEFWNNPLSVDLVGTDTWRNFYDEVQRIKSETISELEEKNTELKTSSTKENEISNMRSTTEIKERLDAYQKDRDNSPDIDAERVVEEVENTVLNLQMIEEIRTGRVNEDLKPDPEGLPVYSSEEIDSIICSWFNIDR